MTIAAVISGPEKAGKTTLAVHLLQELGKAVPFMRPPLPMEVPHSYLSQVGGGWLRHWTGQIDSVTDYLPALIADTEIPAPVVWDRSWACEAIYSNLLDRPDRGNKADWFSTAWFYGRAVQTSGVRIMVLGPSAETLAARRDATDLPVEPTSERAMYESYASHFGWTTTTTVDSDEYDLLTALVVGKYTKNLAGQLPTPPTYCGPLNPKVVFVGEARNEMAPDPAWLPFTSHYTTRLGRAVRPYALRCGWTNVADAPRHFVEGAELVVACGAAAYRYVSGLSTGAMVYSIAHPSAFYRWGRYTPLHEEVESELRLLIGTVLGGGTPSDNLSV